MHEVVFVDAFKHLNFFATCGVKMMCLKAFLQSVTFLDYWDDS